MKKQGSRSVRDEASHLEKLQETLRTAGLRSTAPRIAALQQLAKEAAPVSHGDLALHLEPLGFDRATIYRNLIDLTDAGLVSRSDLHHVWRFELRRQETDHKHPHLVCSKCGEVSCLSDVDVAISSARGKKRKISLEKLEVQLRGLCERCA